MIRRLLSERLVVTPNKDRTAFTITGTGVLDPALAQIFPLSKAGGDPGGRSPHQLTM